MTKTIGDVKVTISDRDRDTSKCNWSNAFWHWDIRIDAGNRGFSTNYYGGKLVKEIEPEEVLYNLISDALSYYQNRNSFVGFCKEFSYDIDTLVEAEHSYKSCKKTYDEFCRIFYISGNEFEDVAYELLDNLDI